MGDFSREAWEQAASTKKERTMLRIRDYEIEEVPMKIVGTQAAFCGKGDDTAFYADFLLQVHAEPDGSDWCFGDIWMGEQELTGAFARIAAAFFAVSIEDDITAHVAEHLPDELAEAQFQAEELTR